MFISLVARIEVFRMNFPNGALWQCLQLCPTLQIYLSHFLSTYCVSLLILTEMTTVRLWKAPTCSVLGFDFELQMVSYSDATCRNAAVVVLTSKWIHSHHSHFSFFFFFWLKPLFLLHHLTMGYNISITHLCLYSKLKSSNTKTELCFLFSPTIYLYCN